MAKHRLHVGCSGWVYPAWRGDLYPEGVAQRRWLAHYAQQLDTVEVNSTFYRLASPKAVEGWVEQTPSKFLFSVKASRYMTHIKRLQGVAERAKPFYAPLEAMSRSGKLGPVLWQLPANFHRDDDRLASALEALPDGRHCFEFRHESWFDDEVYALLRAHGAALVIGDDPERPDHPRKLTADWTYLRFHRGSRGRDGNYSASELDLWARRIAQWRRRADVFAYFNNDQSGYAPRNALALRARLGD